MRFELLLGALLAVAPTARSALCQSAALLELKQQAGFSDAELQAVAAGRVVVKLPDVDDEREVDVLGVVRINAPADFLVERLRRIDDALAGSRVAQQIGRFGQPPGPEDMTGFALPREDIRALRECRPGRCDVKLPADVMDRIQAAVDWSAKDAELQASRAMASWMTEYLDDYCRDGDAALATYNDKQEPLSVAAGFHILLQPSPLMQEYPPELLGYLERFPQVDLPGAEDVYYWSVEEFGLKPVTHLYHTTIYRPPGAAAVKAIIARKQIYASHYFQAAVSFVSIADAEEPGSPAVYVTFLTRRRFDGRVGGLNRVVLERKLRDNLQTQLEDLQRRIDGSYAAQGR